MRPFPCTLISPQGSLFDGQTTSVSAPGIEGRFQVLAGHEHILTILIRGILKIKSGENDLFYAVDSGVLEVDGDRKVVILADTALVASDQGDAERLLKIFDQAVSPAKSSQTQENTAA